MKLQLVEDLEQLYQVPPPEIQYKKPRFQYTLYQECGFTRYLLPTPLREHWVSPSSPFRLH
eukprot:1477047-Rhodomonas_salina.1